MRPARSSPERKPMRARGSLDANASTCRISRAYIRIRFESNARIVYGFFCTLCFFEGFGVSRTTTSKYIQITGVYIIEWMRQHVTFVCLGCMHAIYAICMYAVVDYYLTLPSPLCYTSVCAHNSILQMHSRTKADARSANTSRDGVLDATGHPPLRIAPMAGACKLLHCTPFGLSSTRQYAQCICTI